MDVLAVVGVALWSMMPAYVPNNVAVLLGGGPPIDGGRTLAGNRILGDGKTWQGTIAGILAGGLLALVLNRLAAPVRHFSGIETVPEFPVTIILALPIGAMVGDITASFLKRRMNRARGASVPGLDQLDFVVGALALAALADWNWFVGTFQPAVLAVVLVVTPVLHLSTNYIAYLLDLKRVPW